MAAADVATYAASAAPRAWLEEAGYAVWAIDHSKDWSRELALSRPDVLVFDASERSAEVAGSADEFWEPPEDVPVVVLTRSRGAPLRLDGLPGRAYDYLEKPLDRTRLLMTLRNAVERRQLELRLSHFERSRKSGLVLGDVFPPRLRLDELERIAIESALEHTRGNLSAVGRQLGIGRTTLYRKIKKYGL